MDLINLTGRAEEMFGKDRAEELLSEIEQLASELEQLRMASLDVEDEA